MASDIKKIAIIGANKEALKLLPVIIRDQRSKVVLIADSNRDAMLYKLSELGYRLSSSLDIKVTTSLDEVKRLQGLDIIIDVLQDASTQAFLESVDFKDVEKLGPLSARLLWGVRASSGFYALDQQGDHTTLLTSLREIVDAVRLTTDRKELFSVILKLATESSRSERGSIMLISPEEGTLKVEIAKGMDDEVVRKIRVAMGQGVSGKVAQDGKPIIISGKASDGAFARPMDRSDVKSAMCVPLVVDGDVIGVINVSTSESANAFTTADLNFLSSLASLAAEVIHRSNEYERLRVDAAKYVFWKEVDSVMTLAEPLDRRLTTVSRRLSGFIPGLTCFIYIFDEDSGRLILKGSSVRDTKTMGIVSMRAGEGIVGACAVALKDVILVDRSADAQTKTFFVALPMAVRGKLMGVLVGNVVTPLGFSKYHEAFLKDVRNLLSESLNRQKRSERDALKTRKIFAVDEAGLELMSMSDAKRVTTILATAPASIVGAEGAVLRLKIGDGPFKVVASFGVDDEAVKGYLMPIEKETAMEAVRKNEVVMREFTEEASAYVRSILTKPIILGGEMRAVLTIFNKTSDDSPFPSPFSKADDEVVARFCVYAEKALLNVLRLSSTPQAKQRVEDFKTQAQRPAAVQVRPAAVDKKTVQETLAPQEAPLQRPPLEVFERRTDEIIRELSDETAVMATVRIAGYRGLVLDNRMNIEMRLLESIKKRTRGELSLAVRFNEETFGFVFTGTDDRVVMRLLGAMTELIASDDQFNRAFLTGKVDLLYGFAICPRDGATFAELFTRASNRVKLDFKKAYNH